MRILFSASLLAGVLVAPCLLDSAVAQMPVPVRALGTEWLEARHGSIAFVRTDYGVGSGLVMPSGDAVLTARHMVISADGKLSDDVKVGMPQQPLQNVLQSHVKVIAQDPQRDLALLSLPLTARGANATAAGAPDPATAGASLPCSSAAEHEREKQIAHTHTAHRERLASVHEERPKHARERAAQRSVASEQKESASTHIVWDGPIR